MGDLKVNDDMWMVIGVEWDRARLWEIRASLLAGAGRVNSLSPSSSGPIPSRSQQPRGRTGWQRPGKGFRGRAAHPAGGAGQAGGGCAGMAFTQTLGAATVGSACFLHHVPLVYSQKVGP